MITELPQPDFVVSTLVRPGVHGGTSAEIVDACKVWARGLSFGERFPWAHLDHWIWLPLSSDAPDRTLGRYFVHAGTSRVWDAWRNAWCGHNWHPEKNTPRVSCVWRKANVGWYQLGQMIATAAEPPPDTRGVAWALSLDSDHAARLREYEEKNGPGSGHFDIHSLRWVRHGHPSKEAKTYPLVFRDSCVIEPRDLPGVAL